MAIDPVCGMAVEQEATAARSEHMGKTYHFCSPECKKAFDKDPARYTEGGGREMAGRGGRQT